MYLPSFYVDCAERPCRTEVFTGSAADAACFVYGRHHCFSVLAFAFPVALSVPFAVSMSVALSASMTLAVAFVFADLAARYHDNGSGRAVACAVAAGYSVSERYAVFPDPYCMSYGYGRFFGWGYLQYRSCRAYFRAFHAFRTAVASFV